jgi:hypothetical protein
MSKGYIGIDIGKKGAIVYQHADLEIEAHPIPMIKDEVDYAFMYDIVQHMCNRHMTAHNCNPHIIFEKLGVIFGSSKATAFSMGHQSGAVEMMAISLGIPYTKIPAKQWQKEMFTGVEEITVTGKSSRDTKAMALVAAKRLFPGRSFVFGERASKPHDGYVDALLMSEYAKRKSL